MLEKRISLFLFAVLAVVLVYTIPVYHKWADKFSSEYAIITDDAQHLSVDERMESRFGNTYLYLKDVKQKLASQPAGNILVLLPPQGYINASKLDGGFEVPEPAVFYYFTGYSAITKNSPQVNAANWAILVSGNKRLMIKAFTKPEYRDRLLNMYKAYN